MKNILVVGPVVWNSNWSIMTPLGYISEKWSSHWITWKIDKKLKKKDVRLSLNIMDNCPKGLNYAFSGRKEIHPCVLQDIGPLGLLPCSHSTSSADHSKQGIGYRWPCAILGWLVFNFPCYSLENMHFLLFRKFSTSSLHLVNFPFYSMGIRGLRSLGRSSNA